MRFTLLIVGRTLLLSIKPIAGPAALHRNAFHANCARALVANVVIGALVQRRITIFPLFSPPVE